VNPLQVKKTQEALQGLLEHMKEPGVSVLISKSPCPLFENRMLKKKQKVVFEVDASSCDLCKSCLEELGCPAFSWREQAAEPCASRSTRPFAAAAAFAPRCANPSSQANR